MDIAAIRERIGDRLSDKRFRHTEGVAGLAAELAARLGEDVTAIETAAWLHDAAKSMSIEEQLDYASKHAISLSEDDLLSRGVVHARIGAHIAFEEFGIRDEEILFAIYHHPTGHPKMKTFHKILMAADYLEPNRTFDFRQKLLDEVYGDFERDARDYPEWLNLNSIKVLPFIPTAWTITTCNTSLFFREADHFRLYFFIYCVRVLR